ncbi:MAG: DNA-binding protein, partial [Bacteroidaceae bacterium]|nr:DNA-binding protein [Bacteroidaceae bacterium]
MTGNFVMLQMDDLRKVVTEIVEEVCAKRGLNEKPSSEEGEWITR